MQAIWSDSYSEDSASTTFENARYDPNDYFSLYCICGICAWCDCDSNSDNEFIDDQKAVS